MQQRQFKPFDSVSALMTELPEEKQLAELDALRIHMEENIKGSFSISPNSVWKVVKGT